MEKHGCKLCFRDFANGRALGGHMRSHMMKYYAAKKEEEEEHPLENYSLPFDEGDDFESSSSSSDGEDDESEEKGILYYGLMREKKKKGLCVVQDRESETDSSKNKLKRVRKLRTCGKKSKKSDYFEYYSEMVEPEPEPLSSISDTTPEENVAYCLMMLSRDNWKTKESEYEEEEDSGVFRRRSNQQNEPSKALKTKARGKYRCETCNKVFRSYQALGGHRASHKKIKVGPPPLSVVATKTRNKANADGGSTVAAAAMVVEVEKIHECPVCYRVFSSGQALGGHKRSHSIGAAAIPSSTTSIKPFSRFDETLNIDLNLPAPVEDDDNEISQVENSVVSDAEFVGPIKQKIALTSNFGPKKDLF
ncbi:Zinc finger protein ZAT9 [Abeliophyllum distichum]|uniref:Zinc finger protein ZAT9 n=1 Tax=Abeliophyllum distichum TaxID=126358 RepID=A0ABD1RSA1_9LAMI